MSLKEENERLAKEIKERKKNPLPGDIDVYEHEGTIKWDVCTHRDGSGFICTRQVEAEIFSMLVKIMERLGIDDTE